jgi:hypothetical protein
MPRSWNNHPRVRWTAEAWWEEWEGRLNRRSGVEEFRALLEERYQAMRSLGGCVLGAGSGERSDGMCEMGVGDYGRGVGSACAASVRMTGRCDELELSSGPVGSRIGTLSGSMSGRGGGVLVGVGHRRGGRTT